MKMEAGLRTQSKEGGQGKRIATRLAVLVFGILLCNIAPTQYLASQFSYDSVLGGAVIGHFYWPWSWVVWATDYYTNYPGLFQNALKIAVAGLVVLVMIWATVIFMTSRKGKPIQNLHGSAHWATEDEVKETGLTEGAGVYVGAWKPKKKGPPKYLRHNGPEHVLAFAPTRSGKGVGLVVPTLLSWPASTVVLDNKGENYALSAGWREQYADNIIQRFDPTASPDDEADAHRAYFNPLAELDIGGEREYGDVQNLVEVLASPNDPNARSDAHFDETAKAFLVGYLLHICRKAKAEGKTATLGEAAIELSDSPFEEIAEDMVGSDSVHVRMSGQDMLDREDRERSGVLSTAKRYLSLFRDPVIAHNTSKSTFRVADLMNGDHPMSLYLVIQQRDKKRIRPLIRLMVTQTLLGLLPELEFLDGQPVKSYDHRLLMLLDEFPTLGYLHVVEESIAYLAGYGIKCYLIVQDLTQLNRAYGKEESIVSNCHIRIAYAPNKVETAELLSKMSGTTTVVKRSVQTSGKRHGWFLSNVSESWQEVQRPLLTADEAMRLPGAEKEKDAKGNERIVSPGDMLIFVAGQSPIYGQQILFFKDDNFLARAAIEAGSGGPSGESVLLKGEDDQEDDDLSDEPVSDQEQEAGAESDQDDDQGESPNLEDDKKRGSLWTLAR